MGFLYRVRGTLSLKDRGGGGPPGWGAPLGPQGGPQKAQKGPFLGGTPGGPKNPVFWPPGGTPLLGVPPLYQRQIFVKKGQKENSR